MSSRFAVPTVIAIGLGLVLIFSLFWFIQPSFAGPYIDDSWLILCNFQDTWDPYSAQWVQTNYGGTIADINNPPNNVNDFGQNLFIIGGSKALAHHAPWTGLNETWYAITRPDTYPNMTYYHDEDWHVHLITPYGTDYEKGTDLDIGSIMKGYDYDLRRWVVIVLGYTYWGTAYGAKLVCTQWDKIVVENSYAIYQCTVHGGTEPTQWSFSDFDGVILEYGG